MGQVMVLKNVHKQFSKQVIFENLNYAFNETGCYLLFGHSGCGKTTLLNMLAGLCDFEGSIAFCKKHFKNQVSKEFADKYIAYISQDNYFVDYLTMVDNLKLCTSHENRINELLEQFDLYSIKDHYPNEISGGQKQRMSIIRALLLEKPILLLDEPTASLDKENKQFIFSMLEILKKDHLLIVSSHDKEIQSVCDEIIDFKKLNNYKKEMDDVELVSLKYKKRKYSSLFSMIYKEFTYKHKERKSSWIIGLVIFMSCMMTMLLINPEEKLYSGLERKFGTNQLSFTCAPNHLDECMDLLESKEIDELVLDFSRNATTYNSKQREEYGQGMYRGPKVYTFAYTIPNDPALFHVDDDFLVAGTYFKDKNDIIVSEQYAMSNFRGMPYESLIGEKVTLDIFEGQDQFRICGVSRDLNRRETQYVQMSSFGAALDANATVPYLFMSNEYVQKYYDNFEFMNDKSIVFDCYFDSFSEMMEMYHSLDKDDKGYSFRSVDMVYYSDFQTFEVLSIYFYPVLIVCLIISVVFFAHSEKIKQTYKKYNHCVYLYCGYPSKKVYSGLLLAEMVHKIKLFIVSCGLSVVIAYGVNILDWYLNLFNFKPFIIQPLLLLGIGVSFVLVSSLMDAINFMMIKHYGWFDLLKERRDLL